MDMKMAAETITSTNHPIWDVKVSNGCVPIISGDEEDLQQATLAGFIELGSVLQLPDVGVPWTDFLTKNVTFGQLDSDIRDSIIAADKPSFYPEYDIDGDTLTMTIGKEEE